MDKTTTLVEKPKEQEEKGIKKVKIVDEMQKAYLDYAMSVIVSRALPDARDGLKPVQRRIIYAMFEQNWVNSSKYTKCAAVVGEVLKKYHPHGDTSVYDALVRMAQDFSLRYMLIDGQGNFGSIDGDNAAAMRYTESRLQKISEELLKNINEETVDFADNYSGDDKEPILLPSVLPNLLLNGATGIAVGMATNIPPHNLSEICDAINTLIGDYKESEELIKLPKAKEPFESSSTTEKLATLVKGPDFPTGGIIYDKSQIVQAYATGKGKIVMRGVATIEEGKGGKHKIIINELPFQVVKAKLVSKIADLVRQKKIEGISDLRDESDRDGIRVVIEIKQSGRPQKILNQLYKLTELQSNFNCNFVALVNNEPKVMTLKMILEEFVRHRQQVVIRRSEYNLAKLKEREHILQGLKIALDNIDEVIQTIKQSETVETAKNNLMKKFGFTSIQADHILEMQLRKLARLEREKIEQELKEILQSIEKLNILLKSPQKILSVIKDEITKLKEKYGDERKTKIISGKVGEFNEEDLIANEEAIVTLTTSGYIKRLGASTYKKQKRGGKGLKGMTTKEGDSISEILYAQTHDEVLFFTNNGRVFKKRVWDIPESSRTAKGTNVINLLDLVEGEKVSKIAAVSQLGTQSKYLLFVTEGGLAKKTSVEEFKNIRQSGIIAIKLKGKDKLASVNFTTGDDLVLITTNKGQAIKFSEKDLRAMGRSATGVKGIKLKKDDFVINAQVFNVDEEKDYYTLTISEKGYGKKTALTSYNTQKRGGSGLKTAKVTAKTGNLIDSLIVNGNGDILITSINGIVIRLAVNKVNILSRSTQGVRLMNLSGEDKVSGIAYLEEKEEDED